jgi:hypothetical protein
MTTAVHKPRFHPALAGAPLQLHYDFLAATGALIMSDGNTCNMEAAIALFAGIDPGVGVIVTFSGIDQDAVYVRHGQGWQAEKIRKR